MAKPRDVDLSALGPSEKHMPLFKQIKDDGHIIENDFRLLSAFSDRSLFVVDVGANIGAFSLSALQLVKSVDTLAFEPNISLRWFHQQVASEYEKSGRKFEIINSGLADRSGTIDLYIPRIEDWYVVGEASMDVDVFANPVVVKRLNGYSSGSGFSLDKATVEIAVFDDIFDRDVSQYDQLFLKIDVENFEPKVLKGMQNFIAKYRPIALIENSKRETIDIMRSHGYWMYMYNDEEKSLVTTDSPSGSNIIFVHPDNVPDNINVSNREALRHVSEKQQTACAMEDAASLVPLVQANVPLNFKFGDELAPAMRCKTCGHFGFTPPPQDVLNEYYNTTYALNATSWYSYDADHAQYKVSARSSLVKEIFHKFGFNQDHVLHEFGCAFGGTVAELKRQGFTISGSELNTTAVDEAVSRGNANIFSQPANEVVAREHGKANIVYSFHALEHFSDPIAFLSDLREILDDKSIVVLAVPNGMALDPLEYGYTSYNWFSFPGHLNMWSASSSLCLARAAGYEVLSVLTNPVPVRQNVQPPLETGTGSVIAETVKKEAMERRFLGEELVMTLTPIGSTTAVQYESEIVELRRHLEEHRKWEREIRDTSARTPLVRAEEAAS